MADGVPASIYTHSYPKFEVAGVAEEVNSACRTFCSISNEDAAARALLNSLLKKRRENALKKKEEDASYLEFVEKEEKKIRQLLGCEIVGADKKFNKKGPNKNDFTMEFPKFELEALVKLNASIQRRRNPGGLEKADEEELLDEMAQSKREMSLLEDYLLTSQDSLESCLMRIKGNENRIEVLRRLIEKTEKLHDTTEERRQPFIEAISDDVEMKNGEGYSMVSGSEPAMPASTENHKATGKRAEAIAVLQEHLKGEKNELTNNLEKIKSVQTKIASYRLLIGEQTV